MKVSTTPKLVEHRLSLSLSRIVLLGRYAMVASSDASSTESLFLLSSFASMLALVQDIFDLDCPPHMLNVRHLFTSIGNVILPEVGPRGNDGCLVSDSVLTEKSGHTQNTGRRAYGTWLENSEEAMYDLYHRELGEITMDPPSVPFTPFSDAVLMSSLKAMLGRDANYRSENQKTMISISANSTSRHAFVGLPCGQGKSLSWMVPTLASYMAGRHVGMRIIVLPYKFLLGHVVQQALTLLGTLRKKLTVSFLDSSSIRCDTLPVELVGAELPNLLFLNLDGAATLFRYHLNHLQNLASRNFLKRIYLDEFQQILVEYGFRSSYQSLRQIGRVGVPVMSLSGSLPTTMAMSLMSYCGLAQCSDDDPVDVVHSPDPIGDGYSFDVTIVEDISTSVIEYVSKCRVGACHVLCSSKAMVDAITAGLSKHLQVLSITGDSSSQEQSLCAKKWYKGGCDVLVSTVVALVGNENKLCKTIVVAGFLFNVSSLVQAIGRLRPEQRGPTSKVQVFRFPFRKQNRKDAKLQSQVLYSEILEAGCLREDSREQFELLFTPVGLQQVLSLKQGCYLQFLSKLFGHVRLPCGRCGLCEFGKEVDSTLSSVPMVAISADVFAGRSNCVPAKHRASDQSVVSLCSKRQCLKSDHVVENKKIRKAESHTTADLHRKASWVFIELHYRCLGCGKSLCNGECAGGCYRCGSRYHGYNVCTYNTDRLSKLLPNKGVCFGCFDTSQHKMTAHDIRSCPLKRRLKRLVFLDHKKRGNSFEDYLRKLYSSELTFVSMVASFADKTSLGR